MGVARSDDFRRRVAQARRPGDVRDAPVHPHVPADLSFRDSSGPSRRRVGVRDRGCFGRHVRLFAGRLVPLHDGEPRKAQHGAHLVRRGPHVRRDDPGRRGGRPGMLCLRRTQAELLYDAPRSGGPRGGRAANAERHVRALAAGAQDLGAPPGVLGHASAGESPFGRRMLRHHRLGKAQPRTGNRRFKARTGPSLSPALRPGTTHSGRLLLRTALPGPSGASSGLLVLLRRPGRRLGSPAEVPGQVGDRVLPVSSREAECGVPRGAVGPRRSDATSVGEPADVVVVRERMDVGRDGRGARRNRLRAPREGLRRRTAQGHCRRGQRLSVVGKRGFFRAADAPCPGGAIGALRLRLRDLRRLHVGGDAPADAAGPAAPEHGVPPRGNPGRAEFDLGERARELGRERREVERRVLLGLRLGLLLVALHFRVLRHRVV
mmetsp:Transcript_7903/g.25949  ORF Transcript_7903/g.25949 Transcript_7903/m.25949 type:complete len:434 (+) Transcript_7903:378-1679(+)